MPALEPLPGIRWWRAIGGGLLLELALILVAVPFGMMGRMADLQILLPPATLVIAFLIGLWVARRAARPLLNAAIAGGIAIPLYLAIVVVALIVAPDKADTRAAFSASYLLTHLFKVLGAAAGGWFVARQRSRTV
jgi:hypothetical protein